MGSFYGGGSGVDAPLSSTVPPSEGVAGTAGTMDAAARGDHSHARLTSAGSTYTLDANGQIAITFTRIFSVKPALCPMTIDESASTQPVVYKAISWTQDGNGNYTGVTVQGQRSQAVPQNLATLLLGGVFNLFSNTSAAGVKFTLIALQVSTP